MLLSIAALPAQASMTITKGVFHVGQTIVVNYSNPDQPNTKVTVQVDDGTRPSPEVAYITIVLDGKGNGTAKWVVPDWWFAVFNAPGVDEQSCTVVE